MGQIKLFLVGLCLVAFVGRAHADSANAAVQQGNTAYAQGQFAQAATAYESAPSQGLSNWVLYYNLGNAYYKNGQPGKAIANYERAFRLNPGQEDVIFNLNYALTKAGDPFFPAGTLARLLWRIFFGLSLNVLTVLTTILFVTLCIGGTLFFLKQYRPTAELTLGLIAATLALGLWLTFRIQLATQHEAVVIIPSAEVRSGPNLTYATNFTIPEGRRVLLLDEQEPLKGWLEIGVPSEGLKGWVPETSVEPL